jgi:metal-responsive CopG/Arc/MetJ family transcriptional regulator
MRTRTNLIIEEAILAKIDAIAGEKQKRAAVIETALLEYIAREEAKAPPNDGEAANKKADAKSKK